MTDRTFVLQFERRDLVFKPGQHLNIGLPHDGQQREYSVYSSTHEESLEVLVQVISGGHVSPQLHGLSTGDHVLVSGPHGRFTLDQTAIKSRPFTLIATGTGLAPFHCFARSVPELDYHIIHGVRRPEACYEQSVYPKGRYTACLSQSREGDFHGRVTDYLKTRPIDPEAYYYLCGNADMIYEVFAILTQAGILRTQIFTEVYF